jgi:uncharacterized membrane protein YfcA
VTFPLTVAEAAAAVVVTVLASAVQASVGFGAALLAAPALVLIHPAFVPGPMLLSNLVLTVFVAQREWSEADFEGLKFVVFGRLAGTVAAAALLATISQTVFDACFGVLVLAGVVLSVVHGDIVRSRVNLAIAGVASGLMGTLSSIGGPPVALAYQNVSPTVFRATLGIHFLIGGAMSFLAIWAVGRFASTEVVLAALLVPPALLGYWFSRFGIRWVDARHVRASVLILSAAAAAIVLWRAFQAGAIAKLSE